MKTTILTLLFYAAAFVALLAGDANADDKKAKFTIAEKKFMATEDKYFQRSIESANKRCDTRISATIDWHSFRGEMNKRINKEEGTNQSIHGFCKIPLDRMWTLCRDGHSDSIRANVTAYACKFGGEKKRSMSLKKGALEMLVDWSAKNYDQYVDRYLGAKL